MYAVRDLGGQQITRLNEIARSAVVPLVFFLNKKRMMRSEWEMCQYIMDAAMAAGVVQVSIGYSSAVKGTRWGSVSGGI